MLNALCVAIAGADSGGLERALGSLRGQGFEAPVRLSHVDIGVYAFSRDGQRAAATDSVRRDGAMACCIGPLWYRGRTGVEALESLLSEVEAAQPIDESALRGNFALVLGAGARSVLMNDLLGFVRVFGSPDGLFYSTSWLAACAYVGHVELDDAAAIEYVLLGAVHSNRTVARGITTLPLATAIDLSRRRTIPRQCPWDDPSTETTPSSLESAADALADHLRMVFSEVTSTFGSKVRAALSGGFDSRLIVAGLLSAGCHPELFVYGKSTATDVSIARTVANAAELPLEVVDKGGLDRRLPPPTVDRLISAARFFDGLPNDGIYDTGADQTTRLAQNADGWIALNGGGGEVLRNYFHLPARKFSAQAIVQAFYRGFDSAVFRRAGALAAYEAGLAESILDALRIRTGDTRQPLDRHRVELVYPLFRCHHWMAVNNSVGVRHGDFTTPLVDPVTIRLTWRLPLGWKNAGRLESLLISMLSPAIARLPSQYGFAPSHGPSLGARGAEWMTRLRPVWMRPAINTVGRRLRNEDVPAATLSRFRSLLPGEWLLDPLLDLARLPDTTALARALSVEVTWRHVLR